MSDDMTLEAGELDNGWDTSDADAEDINGEIFGYEPADAADEMARILGRLSGLTLELCRGCSSVPSAIWNIGLFSISGFSCNCCNVEASLNACLEFPDFRFPTTCSSSGVRAGIVGL